MAQPAALFPGSLVLAAPHMDDCVLASGGTLAQLPDPAQVHVIYATDGGASPAPIWPRRDSGRTELCRVRMAEARAALASLGIPPGNVHFLGFPDGRLGQHRAAMLAALVEKVRHIDPDHLLIPFRYDRHADHIALNHVVMAARARGLIRAELTEYFVYYRWRLLPKADVRCYVQPELLDAVPIDGVAARKRSALDCFTSQTTRYYAWQTRPNLTAQLLDEVSRAPEVFLRYDPAFPGASIFTHGAAWLRLAHTLEPHVKRRKDQMVAVLKGELWRNAATPS
jgi:LmbE family N-acetylglucosaminyl deacetylase